MGFPAEKLRRATYADLEAVPSHKVAEILNGVLHVFPRPASPHARTSSQLGVELGPFDGKRRRGPGGWWILDEPELHFGPRSEKDVLVPDLAGWRVERMPRLGKVAHFTLAPDWVCEVLSDSTEATDRTEKMPIYAREGVSHLWLLRPTTKTLEVFALEADRHWKLLSVHRGESVVRAAPFEAGEIDLGVLWIEDEAEISQEAPSAQKAGEVESGSPTARRGKRGSGTKKAKKP
jgi:Uma2 family endonuclease